MKKFASQISVALVCCILGFVVTLQFREISRNEKNSDINSTQSAEITVELEQLRKSKQDLNNKINDLQAKIKKYEDASAQGSESNKELLDELNASRMLTGEVDIKGQGVVITIKPKTNMFGNNTNTDASGIRSDYLALYINYLNAAGAEAISVNDIRITSRTGMTTAGATIKIDNDRVSSLKPVTIKAIGDKSKLQAQIDFPGVMPTFENCDVDIQYSDDVKINKYQASNGFRYAKPVEEKK